MGVFRKICLSLLVVAFALACAATGRAQLLHTTAVLPVGPDPECSPDTLNFGSVTLLDTKTLNAIIKNQGDAPASITSVGLANNVDFSFNGNTGPYTLDPDSTVSYSVTFSPQVFAPPLGKHVGNLTFTTTSGPKTIYLIGDDHIPVVDTISFPSNYWAKAGSKLVVSENLVSPIAGTLDSVRNLREAIRYDDSVLDLISVTAGQLLPSPDWLVSNINILTSGHVTVFASSGRYGLAGKGTLFYLTFYVNDTAKVFNSSMIGLDSSSFGNGFEPIMRVEDGLVQVYDDCTPVFLQTGVHSNSIQQNTPNPVATSTTITYYIGATESGSTPVRILLYNSVGQVVRRIVDEEKPPGAYTVELNASALSDGMYTYTYDCGSRHEIKHLVIAR